MSDVGIRRFLRVLLWVLFGVTVVIAAIYVVNIRGDVSQQELKHAAEPFLIWTYCLIAAAAILAIIFPIIDVIRYPKRAIKFLFTLLGLGIVIAIGYAFASAEPIFSGTKEITDRTVLLVSGTGINTTFILIGIAVLLLIITGIQSFFRK